MCDRENERKRQRYAEDPEYRKHRLGIERAWRRRNRDKVNARTRLRWSTDPKFRKKRLKCGWNSRLKREHGITIEDYDRLFKKQKGRCAICRKKRARRRLYVDHDHRRRVVRRLLCCGCNVGLGLFKDDVRLLRRAVAYLEAAAKAYRAGGKRPRGGPQKGAGGRKRKR